MENFRYKMTNSSSESKAFSSYSFRKSLSNLPFANKLIILTLYPLSFLVIIFRYNFLPDKYFYDSNKILALMRTVDTISMSGDSYNNTALLFKSINFLKLTSLLQWSIVISLIVNIFLAIYFLRVRIEKNSDLIISYCFLGLLNLYVFNLSKEIIQFIFFSVMYCVIAGKFSNNKKCIVVFSMFVLESVFFRSYYILIGTFFVAIYFLFSKVLMSNKNRKIRITQIVAIAAIGLYLFLILCELIMPNEYMKLLAIRNRLTISRIGDESAQTLILNLIDSGNNKLLFLLNYFINFLRIMFPVELLPKGLYYWIFCFFQFLCTFKLINCVRNYHNLSENDKLCLFVMAAYCITGAFFEPDFGSFVRHEAATAPILFTLMIKNFNTQKKEV